MATGLNRRVTAFMDIQGAEGMVKVWEKKHDEDIQSMAYYHPNILITGSYDGDIIVWSTETNQPACRLNAAESHKPMMGSDKPTRVESQRTLVAKRFNLAITRAVNPDRAYPDDSGKLNFTDLLKAQIASEEAAEAAAQAKASAPPLAPPTSAVAPVAALKWNKRQAILGQHHSSNITATSDATTIVNSRQDTPRMSADSTPIRCPNCFGIINKRRNSGNKQIAEDKKCLCREGSESRESSIASSKTYASHLFTAIRKNSYDKSTRRTHLLSTDKTTLDVTSRPHSIVSPINMGTQRRSLFLPHKGPQQLITSNSVGVVITLAKRKVDKRTAVVLSSGLDGWVRAWSVHYRGGLLGQFRANHRFQDAITAMSVDEKNLYLVTGDAGGYIKVWYIGDYCTKTPYTATLSLEEKQHFIASRYKVFPYFAGNRFFRRFEKYESKCAQDAINPPPKASDPERTVKKPTLLTSVRGHTKPITCVLFCSGFNILITGAEDNNVRSWTIGGRYLGQLGTDMWPRLEEGNDDWVRDYEFSIPDDVRRVASPRTLRVLHGGVSKRWKLVKNGIMKLIGPWFRLGLGVKKDASCHSVHSSTAVSPVASSTAIPTASQTVTPTSRSMAASFISKDSLSMPVMSHPVEVGASRILGKSYRQVGHHRALPAIKNIYSIEHSVQIWPKLPIKDMEKVKTMAEYEPPRLLIERDERRRRFISQLQKTRAGDYNRRRAKVKLQDHVKSTYVKGMATESTESLSPGQLTGQSTPSFNKTKRPRYSPSRKDRNKKPRTNRKQSELETITVDKLAMEIAEILEDGLGYRIDAL